ncbi:MAG: hypothetical protein ACOVQ4_04080 [Flectobacillus sp.]|uniref:hypothetical protein n=1 Tax=Flectobacillus sp. TaxID=50419 RepID=UPI003B9C9982
MTKTQSISNILKMKHEYFEFEAPWSKAFGNNPSDTGIWLVWGREKNGKSTFALMLAKYLSTKKKVLYVSGEEGLAKEFVDTMIRAGITSKDKQLGFLEYESLEDIKELLRKRNAPKIVFFDNLTVYKDEFRGNVYSELKREFPNVLFIFLAHEDRNEPSPATARTASKLAKVIVHIKGLKANVYGRVVGGEYTINTERAELYWGQNDVLDE